MQCANCGTDNQTGKYCTECGAALEGSCPNCGAEATPGASYCNACGATLTEDAGGGGGSKAPWVIAAAAIVTVVLVLVLPRDTERVPAPRSSTAPVTAPGAAGGGMGGAAGGGTGGLSADMRTNADRLFNRIMMAAEQGNQGEVDQFMPMAIQAYDMVEGLDDDGLYHLALLHLTAGDLDAARSTADRILQDSPDHILALGVAASAAETAGDDATARSLWQRLVAAFPQESTRSLPEYMDHQVMLSEYQQRAQQASSGP